MKAERDHPVTTSSRGNPKGRQRDTPKWFYTDRGSDEEESAPVSGRGSKRKKKVEEEDSEDSVGSESEEEDEDADSEEDEDDDDDEPKGRVQDSTHWTCSVRSAPYIHLIFLCWYCVSLAHMIRMFCILQFFFYSADCGVNFNTNVNVNVNVNIDIRCVPHQMN